MNSTREGITGRENAGALSYVLETSIHKIEQEGKIEPNRKKSDALYKKARKAKEVLRAKQKPVLEENELETALNEVSRHDHLLKSIETGRFSQIEVNILESSDLKHFLDEGLLDELKRTKIKIATKISAFSNLYSKNEGQLRREAEQDWKGHVEELKAEIEELKASDRKGSKSRMKDLQLEISKGHEQWVKYRITDLDQQQGQALNDVSGGIDDLYFAQDLKNMLDEAKNIEMERINAGLEVQVKELQKQLDDGQLHSPLRENIQASLDRAQAMIRDRSIVDPMRLRTIMGDLKNGKIALGESIEELKDINKRRPEIEKNVVLEHEKFKESLKKITPDLVQRLKTRFKKELAKDSILQNQVKLLEVLADPNSQERREMKEWDDKLASNISFLPPEELQTFEMDVKTYQKLIPLLEIAENEDYELAKAAHISIVGLEKAKSGAEVRKVLDKNLGVEDAEVPHRSDYEIYGDKSKHVKILPSSEFERYKKYTTGNMVYHERMNASGTKEWYIFVDERAFKDENQTKELKRQLTQELLHAEFERGGTTQDEEGHLITFKKKLEKEYITDHPERWADIREAFVEWMQETGEKDSHGGDEWPNLDILSELFSLQNELGQKEIKKRTLSPKEKLNNLLYAFNVQKIAQAHLPNLEKTAEKYEINEINFGSKEGLPVEAGYIDPNDVGASGAPQGPGSPPVEVPLDTAKKQERQDKTDDAKRRLEILEKSVHLKKIDGLPELVQKMLRYNEETSRMNQIGDPGYDTKVESRNAEILKDIASMESAIGDMSVRETNTDMSLMRNLWNNTTFLSIEDFVQAGKQFMEYWKRRMTRRVEDHAARINMAIFGGSGMGLEATAAQQKVEAGEVGEWEGRIDKLDPIQLEALLDNLAKSATPDRDRFKAILRTLAKKGRLNWRKPSVWKILNKLQDLVYFREDDPDLLNNPNLLRLKLAKAIGAFYDQDEFPGLDQSNASSYDSEMNKFIPLHKETPTTLGKKMEEILVRNRSGEKTANPIEYESIIDFCISSGRSFAENATFYLIAGIADGILAPNRGLAMATKGENSTVWPPVQWFETATPSQAYYQKLCADNFAEDYEAGSLVGEGRGEKFRNWVFTDMVNKPIIADRVDKSASKAKWDPDWCRTVTCMGNAEHIRQFLAGQGGRIVAQPAAVAASYVGMLQYLEENAINPKRVGRADFARLAGSIVMQEGIISGTAYGSDLYTRQVNNEQEPNEAGRGRYGGQNLRFHRDKLSDFLAQINPDLFQLLRGRELTTTRDKKDMGVKVAELLNRDYPGMLQELGIKIEEIDSIDNIFNKLRPIMSSIFNRMSGEKYQNLLKYVVQNAGNTGAANSSNYEASAVAPMRAAA